MGFKKDSIEAEIRDHLIHLAEEQELVTKDEIAKEYFEPKTFLKGLFIKQKVDKIFGAVVNYYKKERIIYCSLNSNNEWGIPRQSEEHEYKMRRTYKDIKARNETAKKVFGSARRLGYFKDRMILEEISVPRLESGEKKESDI